MSSTWTPPSTSSKRRAVSPGKRRRNSGMRLAALGCAPAHQAQPPRPTSRSWALRARLNSNAAQIPVRHRRVRRPTAQRLCRWRAGMTTLPCFRECRRSCRPEAHDAGLCGIPLDPAVGPACGGTRTSTPPKPLAYYPRLWLRFGAEPDLACHRSPGTGGHPPASQHNHPPPLVTTTCIINFAEPVHGPNNAGNTFARHLTNLPSDHEDKAW